MTTAHLVGDIGGTHVRLALLYGQSKDLQAVEVRHCEHFHSLQDAIADYLHSQGVQRVDSACLAVACPVNAERIQLTNNPWNFSRSELCEALGLSSVHLINDFTAMALGMMELHNSELISLTPDLSWTAQTRVVIGPGTGLGFSALVPNGAVGWTALATEGGHVAFAPRDALEIEILKVLMKRHNNRVSAERVLCGQGLLNIYSALCEIQGSEAQCATPAAVTQAAQRSDPTAQLALSRFCSMLGDYAGDMVLALGALGGVYLCGGILPRIQTEFLGSDFLSHFRNKGRFSEYLAQVPVALSIADQPGLLGAAVALRQASL